MRGTTRGPVLILLLPALNVLAWTMFPPGNDGRGDFVRQMIGELIASTVVVLFALALLLSTRARWLEPSFGGLDKMYRSHREAGVAGFLLLVLPVALIPWRLDYFFYTVRHADDALFVTDIAGIADGHENLEFHLTISSRDGSLTVDRVLSAVDGNIADSSVYLCGPVGMIRAFEEGFTSAGADPRSIHYRNSASDEPGDPSGLETRFMCRLYVLDGVRDNRFVLSPSGQYKGERRANGDDHGHRSTLPTTYRTFHARYGTRDMATARRHRRFGRSCNRRGLPDDRHLG